MFVRRTLKLLFFAAVLALATGVAAAQSAVPNSPSQNQPPTTEGSEQHEHSMGEMHGQECGDMHMQNQSMTGDMPMHDHSVAENMHGNSSKHFDEVNRHGDMAMGFSHRKTTHHFRLTPTGGAIEVQANSADDTLSRTQIQDHMQHISKAFKQGDFSAPMETHGRIPPGVPTMEHLKAAINYKYVKTDRGGEVLISTANPEALKAVHEFLRFQIEDHRTGDPETVQNP